MKNNKTQLLTNVLSTTKYFEEAQKSYNFHKEIIDGYLSVNPFKKFHTEKEQLKHIVDTFTAINTYYIFNTNKYYNISIDPRFETLTEYAKQLYNALYYIYNGLTPKNVTSTKIANFLSSGYVALLLNTPRVDQEENLYRCKCKEEKENPTNLMLVKNIHDAKKTDRTVKYPIITLNQICWILSFSNPDFLLIDQIASKLIDLGIYSLQNLNDSICTISIKNPSIVPNYPNINMDTINAYVDSCKCIKNICGNIQKYPYTPALCSYVLLLMQNSDNNSQYNYITNNDDLDKTVEFMDLYKTMQNTMTELLMKIQDSNKIMPPVDLSIDVLDTNGNVYKITDICSIVNNKSIKLTLNVISKDYLDNRFNDCIKAIERDYELEGEKLRKFIKETFDKDTEYDPCGDSYIIRDYDTLLTKYEKTFLHRFHDTDQDKAKELIKYLLGTKLINADIDIETLDIILCEKMKVQKAKLYFMIDNTPNHYNLDLSVYFKYINDDSEDDA